MNYFIFFYIFFIFILQTNYYLNQLIIRLLRISYKRNPVSVFPNPHDTLLCNIYHDERQNSDKRNTDSCVLSRNAPN